MSLSLVEPVSHFSFFSYTDLSANGADAATKSTRGSMRVHESFRPKERTHPWGVTPEKNDLGACRTF